MSSCSAVSAVRVIRGDGAQLDRPGTAVSLPLFVTSPNRKTPAAIAPSASPVSIEDERPHGAAAALRLRTPNDRLVLGDDRAPDDLCRLILPAARQLLAAGLELVHELGHRREPLGRILLERALDRGHETERQLGPLLEQARHRVVDVPHRHGDEVVAGKRHLPAQQLVENGAEPVHVALRVGPLPLRLLGRDVVARPDDRARGAVDVDHARNPEVGHLRAPVPVQQDVLRLDVAVDQPALVGEGERPADLEGELEREIDRERPLAIDQMLERLTRGRARRR